ncbi:YHYH domain-containing protein [Bacillus sp. T33-2]|uniref:YHYH domain-containing protein n=1 Tax=Bacillus sp. T33-2 TaxID=2054168 RepID=UPI000C76EEFC|nr:YHYH domain-containing protein [Bacillus sp. T33-2]PLR98419.1 hypothetical protein CVD19_04870 [Bacillus sp. T33-2]
MKKLVAWLVFLLILSVGMSAYAHGGRTDSSGGHNCGPSAKAKGLCTGYHYHNGGGTSSGGSSSGSTPQSTPSQSNDKDCTDFASYDEVVAYWNAKGYTADYDPERLDGWGNKVDDGIPCEAGGYDTAKLNGSQAQIAAKTASQDKAKGEKEGYAAGKEAGYHGQSNSVDTTGSDAYKEGFNTGFQKGWEEGAQKLKAEKETADKAGYQLGQKQDQIVIPKEYEQNDSVKASYEEGFKRAVSERDAAQKEEFSKKGYEEGKNDVHNVPTDVKEEYAKAYEEGYQKGQSELKEMYVKQGYEAAFTMLEYEAPKLGNVKLVGWYKEGFESNKEIKKIAAAAFSMGLAGETYQVPSKYKIAEPIFKHNFQLGMKDYEKQQAETNQQAAAGGVVLLLAWLGRRFYVAKKMVS